MGDIHLKPNFGLSNRLRAISAALALANSFGRRLIVHWRDTDDCHADWKDLFETPGEFEVVDVRHSVTGNADDKFSANNPDYFDWRNTNEAIRACLAGDEKDVYIENFRRFFPGGDYDWIRPVKKIRDELDSILRTMPPRRIGIHIRRTDNMEAAFISPTELFADAVRNKLESEPETAFFLATDGENEKRLLTESFPDKVFTRNNVAGRFDDGGIKDALIDLLLLSKSTELWGSVWSSFSQEASELGKIPLLTLGDENRIAVSVVLDATGTETWFRTCLDALAKQFLSRIEILCRPPENSKTRGIYREFAERDARFRTVPPGGNAIRMARGKYTAFIRSPSVPRDTFSKWFFEFGERHGADDIVCLADAFSGKTGETEKLAKKLNRRLRRGFSAGALHRKHLPGPIAAALFLNHEEEPFFFRAGRVSEPNG